MAWRRAVSYMLCGLSLAAATYFWLTLEGLGFPDGHLTELERVRQPLYRGFALINILLAPFFGYLGCVSPNKVINNWMPRLFFVYLGLMGAFVGLNYYVLPAYFRGGGGG